MGGVAGDILHATILHRKVFASGKIVKSKPDKMSMLSGSQIEDNYDLDYSVLKCLKLNYSSCLL